MPALALGLPTPTGEEAKRFGRDTGLKAALLKARFGLPLSEFPDFPQAVESLTCQLADLDPSGKFNADALAWKLLGIDSSKKFSAKAVQTALINRALGNGREDDPKKGAAKLLARDFGARRSDANELRQAAIRQWVGGPASTPAPAPTPTPEPTAVAPPPTLTPPPAPAPTPTAVPPLDPDTFARRVQEAARTSPTGRFGANKVFIAHVWRALQQDPNFANMSEEEFKRRLAEANNARRLNLSRADLVEAMDPEDVRRSEVRYLDATFHFILV